MDDIRTAPHIDALAGGFVLIWAAVGWYSYTGNAALRASLWTQADPGPALVPLIVLTLLSVGGGFLLVKGLLRGLRLWPNAAAEETEGLPPAHTYLLPLGFALTLTALSVAMPATGFLPAAIVFCLFWLWALSSGGHSPVGWALRLLVAATIGGGVHFIFSGLLSVPLPG